MIYKLKNVKRKKTKKKPTIDRNIISTFIWTTRRVQISNKRIICESFFFLNFLLFDKDWEEVNESWLYVESCESSVERKDAFSSEKEESWNTLEYVSLSQDMLSM